MISSLSTSIPMFWLVLISCLLGIHFSNSFRRDYCRIVTWLSQVCSFVIAAKTYFDHSFRDFCRSIKGELRAFTASPVARQHPDNNLGRDTR